ncbi:MAG: hypothetical protein ACTHJ5_14545 [Ilyomonas sp.]
MKKGDVGPLVLLIISLGLLFLGVILKSIVIIAGVTGLVVSWFLCIDTLIVNQKMTLVKKAVFALAVIGLPIAITVLIGG